MKCFASFNKHKNITYINEIFGCYGDDYNNLA